MRSIAVAVALAVSAMAVPNVQAASVKYAPTVVELKRENFQKVVDGKPVDLYTLRNRNGVTIKVTNYGAKVEQILVPDRKGVFADIALGFDSIDSVMAGQPSMGAFIGRYANRIGNAKFTLEGKEYQLAANNGINSLHGGAKGSRFQVFNARQLSPSAVELSYVFKDGEENYPGTLPVTVVYSLNDKNEFSIDWVASAQDKATVANFTGHTFFNLAGDPTTLNTDYVMTVNADRYLPVDKNLTPTGEAAEVAGTPMDFRKPKAFGKDIGADFEQLKLGNGYDHHYVLNAPATAGALNFAASAVDPKSGRSLEVWTTEPGVQLFSGNNLAAKAPLDAGKGGRLFAFRGAFCLEPSHFPDAPNKAHFPTTTLKPGEFYTGRIVYKFGVKK
ncbi:aldose epimerase family protein [Uliginosibacterium sp. 31-16]|uniref:aldose epimerase family protein n=1 Tax=Uliginosibacterium sp. 31-16 TaxID=3068315 RepID=UPI00273D72A2|nr:aldose epimerase family protein [Uliginosibacterium sp. 31-16]MDP5238372.1 aldose epimerase family protein [Uliginosibacterium sp. 31-16]